MVGAINRALEDLICTRHGEAVWQQIVARAHSDTEHFLNGAAYPPGITSAMINAATEVLDIPRNDFLEEFGEHTVWYANSIGYGDVLRLSGSNLTEFLLNVDQLRSRLEDGLLAVPLKVRCIREQPGCLRVCMSLEDSRWRPLVVGILTGLSNFYGTPVQMARGTGELGCESGDILVRMI